MFLGLFLSDGMSWIGSLVLDVLDVLDRGGR